MYTDQQRWDTIGHGGNELIKTPNLDGLAKRGILFDRVFCNCPCCMPSRTSMLSGQYPSSLGICVNGIEMDEDVDCIQHILKRFGYVTGNIGKLHFKNHSNRDHREPHPHYGFDVLVQSEEPGCYEDAYLKWVGEKDASAVDSCRCDTPPAWNGKAVRVNDRETNKPYVFEGPEELTHSAFVAEETVEFIERYGGVEPFFCVAGFFSPHSPINPPQRFVDMYDPVDMPLPKRNEGENYDNTSDEQWRKVKAYYYALVSHIDDQIGRILRALDEKGLRDDTIVVFMSDHGDYLGDNGRIDKCGPDDGCCRVPMVVSYPKGFDGKGEIKEEIIEAVDVVPTLLDWCGVQVPSIMQGRSFRGLLEGGEYVKRESAFIEFRYPFGVSFKVVHSKDYSYARWNDGKEKLCLLKSDPNQLTDVSGDAEHSEVLYKMRDEMLRRWFDVEKQYPLCTGAY